MSSATLARFKICPGKVTVLAARGMRRTSLSMGLLNSKVASVLLRFTLFRLEIGWTSKALIVQHTMYIAKHMSFRTQRRSSTRMSILDFGARRARRVPIAARPASR